MASWRSTAATVCTECSKCLIDTPIQSPWLPRRLAKLLASDPEWYEDAVPLLEEAIAIADRLVGKYKIQGDLVSAALIAEGTCFALDGVLDPQNVALERFSRQAESLFSVLEEDEKEEVRTCPPCLNLLHQRLRCVNCVDETVTTSAASVVRTVSVGTWVLP